MHLWASFYIERPLFDELQLERVQLLLHEHLPHWSRSIRAGDHEESVGKLLPRQARGLYSGITELKPDDGGPRRITLTGAVSNVWFFLNHSAKAYPSMLNMMTLEVYERERVEGLPSSLWMRRFFEGVCRLPVRYARSETHEEFYSKNMISNEKVTHAIGVDIEDAIPGIYWLNYLGALQVELMGRERILAAPAFEVKAVGDGVLLAMDALAESWNTEVYREQERAVIAHLGEQFFFSRVEPDRKTIAPNFNPRVRRLSQA